MYTALQNHQNNTKILLKIKQLCISTQSQQQLAPRCRRTKQKLLLKQYIRIFQNGNLPNALSKYVRHEEVSTISHV